MLSTWCSTWSEWVSFKLRRFNWKLIGLGWHVLSWDLCPGMSLEDKRAGNVLPNQPYEVFLSLASVFRKEKLKIQHFQRILYTFLNWLVQSLPGLACYSQDLLHCVRCSVHQEYSSWLLFRWFHENSDREAAIQSAWTMWTSTHLNQK